MSERYEMAKMTQASEIAPNVFLGPSPDPLIPSSALDQPFDVFIEASDLAQIPDAQTLESLRAALDTPERPTVHFEIPGSGSIMPPTWSHAEVDGLLNTCKWIWEVSGGSQVEAVVDVNVETDTTSGALKTDDTNGDVEMPDIEVPTKDAPAPAVKAPSEGRKILIHCPDGYTESTLLGMTYFMFAHGLPVSEAWVSMHKDYKRNFFAYATDVALLTAIQTRILNESPVRRTAGPAPAICLSMNPEPEWLHKLDGSLPSRILPYMYLGNLNHANNAPLLRELGIKRIVSVGEKVNWGDRPISSPTKIEGGTFDGFEFVVVENVQDNGVDSLSGEIERCLNFIGKSSIIHAYLPANIKQNEERKMA
jgi:dual specificity MAP kinase phosphatase